MIQMHKLILNILLSFIVMCSYGQKYIGFKIGSNYSMIKSKSEWYTNEIDSKFSYEFGVYAKTDIVNNFNVNCELEYINYATSIYSRGFSPSHSREYSYDLNLGYLSINVLPEFSIGENVSFFFNLGPYFSVLIHSKMNGILDGYGPTTDFTGQILSGSANEYFRTIDAGFLTSSGLHIKIAGKTYISPQIRYRFGLVDFGDNYFTAYNMPIYIRSLSFSVAIESKILD